MGTQDYKIKVEYGVSAVVLLVGVFFIFQAFTIETSREAVGPRTMPLWLAIARLSSAACGLPSAPLPGAPAI